MFTSIMVHFVHSFISYTCRHRTLEDWRYWVFTSIIGNFVHSFISYNCRHRTQEDWRYWVFTFIMGHFMHSYISFNCRHRTQEDWRYWVFTSIMGHFVHSFAQEVSNISPQEMERTSLMWLQVLDHIYYTPIKKLKFLFSSKCKTFECKGNKTASLIGPLTILSFAWLIKFLFYCYFTYF